MHCPGCGLIIGKESPPEQCRCPRCSRVLRVLRFGRADDFDAHEFVPVEGPRKRFVGVYTSEAMLRFLVSGRTPRAVLWEPLLIEVEEERLKAFTRNVGWVLAGVFRDPGPRAPDGQRPFARLAADLTEGVIDTVLVSDFGRVARKDLHALHELALKHGALLVAAAPHPHDENLAHDEVDYDQAPDAWAAVPDLERLWTPAVTRALEALFSGAGWHWTAYAGDVLARAMGAEPIRAWRASDPACRERPWKDVLTRFAIARSRRTGDLAKLPLPRLLVCTLCRRRYLDAALPVRLMELTAGRTTYCSACLSRAFFHDLRAAAEYVGPREIDAPADAEGGAEFFRELPRERLHAFLKTLLDRIAEVEAKGTHEAPSNLWLGALRDLGILRGFGEVARADSFYKAADGHLNQSLGAALLCNWLSAQGIAHRLDSKYPHDEELNPATSVRADFLARDVLVEFLGMRGKDEFKKRIECRLQLAAAGGIPVMGVYAEDLLGSGVLERKAAPLRAAADHDGERRAS